MRRWLRSAERLTDAAIRCGLSDLKTSFSKAIASLVSVTFADHLRGERVYLRAVIVAFRAVVVDLRAAGALAVSVLHP